MENIGSLLAVSILSKQEGRPCGLNSYRALVSVCNEAMSNNREVSLDMWEEIFSKEGRKLVKSYQLLSSDNQRVKNIRFIEKWDKNKITIARNALNAYKRICQRAERLLRKKGYRK